MDGILGGPGEEMCSVSDPKACSRAYSTTMGTTMPATRTEAVANRTIPAGKKGVMRRTKAMTIIAKIMMIKASIKSERICSTFIKTDKIML